jgi:hypothetical protein
MNNNHHYVNIHQALNAIRHDMQLLLDEVEGKPTSGSESLRLYQGMKNAYQQLNGLGELYVCDRLKVSIAAGVPRVHEGVELSAREKEFSHGFNEDELGVLYTLRARREVSWQADHDWKAAGAIGTIPAWEDFGIDGRESKFLTAVQDWLKGGEIGPRPQKTDFGL